MSPPIEFEVCIDSVEGALAAQRGGANRVELCGNLYQGGTTPSLGLIQAVRAAVTLQLMVMVRPRGGDFCFSDHEVDVMLRDIDVAAAAGADGVVVGVLLPDGGVDVSIVRLLMDAARPMSVTFHRAFDWTPNPYESLDSLADVGVDRVLTSGQQETAELGIPLLQDLVRQAGEAPAIMPGAGVGEKNIADILSRTGARQIHFSASETIGRSDIFCHERITFTPSTLPDPRVARVTSEQRVRSLVKAARQRDGGHASNP